MTSLPGHPRSSRERVLACDGEHRGDPRLDRFRVAGVVSEVVRDPVTVDGQDAPEPVAAVRGCPDHPRGGLHLVRDDAARDQLFVLVTETLRDEPAVVGSALPLVEARGGRTNPHVVRGSCDRCGVNEGRDQSVVGDRRVLDRRPVGAGTIEPDGPSQDRDVADVRLAPQGGAGADADEAARARTHRLGQDNAHRGTAHPVGHYRHGHPFDGAREGDEAAVVADLLSVGEVALGDVLCPLGRAHEQAVGSQAPRGGREVHLLPVDHGLRCTSGVVFGQGVLHRCGSSETTCFTTNCQ